MRKLVALLTIFSLNAYAAAPTGVGGEQGSLSYTNNLKAPNYQVTSLGGVNSRIETGNTNLLMNPSFEHTTVTTGWTATGISAADAEASIVVDGKKSLKLTLNSTLNAYQDSTVNAAQLVGLQGVASIKVKTSNVTGLKACVRNAGTTSSTLCVNIPSDNTWKHISIPFIMTATSNGIALTSTGTSGTVYVDDAFVGTSAPFQDVSGAQLVGTVKITGCSSYWNTASTSFADFSVQTSCVYTTTGSAQSPSTMIPAIKFASLPAGEYRLEYEGLISSANSSGYSADFQFSDGTNTAREISTILGGTSSVFTNGISQTISYSTAQSNITLSVKARTSNAAGATRLYGTTGSPGVIKVWYFPPATKIYSQASQDYAWTSFTPTLGIGYGTVSELRAYHSRKGQMLRVMGSFRIGTAAAQTGEIYLPSGLTIDASYFRTSQSNILGFGSGFRRIINAGGANTDLIYRFGFDGTNTDRLFLTSASNGDTAGGTFTKTNVNSAFNNSDVISFYYEVPIQGWSDYGVIVGSFAGIEKCANDYECTDTFSASVSSTGVISNQNLSWLTSCSWSPAGTLTCNLGSTLKDGVSGLSQSMLCWAIPFGNKQGERAIQFSSSTTQIVFINRSNDGTANVTTDLSVFCSKTGQDYKPKTAKVASSIGVPTVPGITTQAIDTFSFSFSGSSTLTAQCSSSPCYLDQLGCTAGTADQSCAVKNFTRSGVGSYSANFNKTYTKVRCNVNGRGDVSGWSFNIAYACNNCSSVTISSVNISATAATDIAGVVTCQGSY